MSKILNLLIHTSIVSSLLILLIFMLRFIFKDKINTRLQYALWLIIAIRLLIPFNFQWNLEVKSTSPKIDFLNFILNNNTNPYERNKKEYKIISNMAEFFDSAEPQANKNNLNQSYRNDVYQPSANMNIEEYGNISNGQSAAYSWNLSYVLFITWIIGVVCILMVFEVHNVSFHKKIMKSIMPYSPSENSYNNAAKMVGLKHKVPVYLSNSLSSPCIIGIFNPMIVLTKSVIHDTEATKFALMHEMVHYKQKDNFFRLLGNILCALYWFNPLIWLSAKAAINDAELCCDSRVIQNISSNEYLNYCRTLLSIAGSSHQTVAAAMSTGGRKMKKRIDMILKSKQNCTITITAAIICLSLGAASFINISVKAENLDKTELLTENNIKGISSETTSLSSIHEVYQILTSLPNPNDNYKINTITINNTSKNRNTRLLAHSLCLEYEFSKNESVGGLSNDDVKRINVNALRLFSSIPDLEAITISYVDKPANSLIRNEKSPISYSYLRSEIEAQYGNLSAVKADIEDLNITPKIDNSFWQSLGDNNVLIVCGYSELYSKLGIDEREYNEDPEIASKLFSRLGAYDKSWESNKSTIYRFSPNPVYSDWSNLMIITDESGNIDCHGIILSDFN